MPSTNSQILFKYGLQSAFDALTKDSNTIYFITDTNRIYVGDFEYTRSVRTGSEAPEASSFAGSPEGFLYVQTLTDGTAQLYAKTGGSWRAIDVLPKKLADAITVGDNTSLTPSEGETIKIPKITFDSKGNATYAADVNIQLPTTDLSNYARLDGAAFTGEVTVQTPAADMSPATKKYVDDAIGGISELEYEVVTSLPATGQKGVIYLIANSGFGNNVYDEYIYIGNTFELIGSTQVDINNFIPKVNGTTGEVPKITMNGDLESTGFTLGKTVPADAKLTDTTYTVGTNVDSDNRKVAITLTSSEGGTQEAEIPVMSGATAAASGIQGLVPRPNIGEQNSVLSGAGTWVENANTTYTLSGTDNGSTWITYLTPSRGDVTASTIPSVAGASEYSNGTVGLVPPPAAGDQDKYLAGDGTWKQLPTETQRLRWIEF